MIFDQENCPYSLTEKAFALYDEKKFDEVIESCKAALKNAPKYVVPRALRGLAYANKRNFEKSIAQYDKAITIDPYYLRTYVWKFITLFEYDKIEEAEICFINILKFGLLKYNWEEVWEKCLELNFHEETRPIVHLLSKDDINREQSEILISSYRKNILVLTNADRNKNSIAVYLNLEDENNENFILHLCIAGSMDKKSIKFLLALFRKLSLTLNKYMLSLDLRQCALSYNEGSISCCEHNLFITLNNLHTIDLSFNDLTYHQVRQIADIFYRESGHPNLKILNLSANRILLEKEYLEELGELGKKFSKCKKLETVNIGQNFLAECNALFEASEIKIQSYKYGFFKTQPKIIPSLSDNSILISHNNWVVSLVCKKNTEHAKIYMEGINEFGQRFLNCYHIMTTDTLLGKATIYIETNKQSQVYAFSSEKYYIIANSIKKVFGEELHSSMRKREGESIDYSIVSGSSSGGINCVEWCISELNKIGIKIDRSYLILPSLVAGGTIWDKCILM